jgi:hypothetical protein
MLQLLRTSLVILSTFSFLLPTEQATKPFESSRQKFISISPSSQRALLNDSEVAFTKWAAVYANAAHCVSPKLTDWNCYHCDDHHASNTSILSVFFNYTTTTRGYLAVNHVNRSIIIAFRGSDNPWNWLTNINAKLSPATDVGPGSAKVHSGFKEAFKSIITSVKAQLLNATETYMGYDVLFTGHSLGGGK